MILTHYYNKNVKLFQSVSDSDCSDRIIHFLSEQEGRAYKRFCNFEWYREQRLLTEKWLFSAFTEKGGKPSIEKPRYFILGENHFLESSYGCNVGILQIELDSINEDDISFTLDDSMKIYVENKQKFIVTKKELLAFAVDKQITIEKLVEQKAHNNEYIEAQIWNMKYFVK